MLEAEGCDLGVEDQIPASFRLDKTFTKKSQKTRTRLENAKARTGEHSIERCQGLVESRRRVEQTRVGNDPHELGGTEYGQGPGLCPLGEPGELLEHGCVLVEIFPMSVHENVGVDRDHR